MRTAFQLVIFAFTSVGASAEVAKRQTNPCLFGIAQPLGATVQYSMGGAAGQYPSGTTATMVCLQGTPLGTTTAVCLNGVWQPSLFSGCSLSNSYGSPYSAGQCLVGLAAPLNAYLSYSTGTQLSGPYAQGTSVTMQCLNGQLPVGASSSVCLNGVWQPSVLGYCSTSALGSYNPLLYSSSLLPYGSPSLSSLSYSPCYFGVAQPLGGYVGYSNGMTAGPFPVGTIATIFCNAGYLPTGQTTATCQNGQFTPALLGYCTLAGRRRR